MCNLKQAEIMTTLYSRLTDTAKQRLEDSKEDFPVSAQMVIESMEEISTYLDLTFDSLLWLKSHNFISEISPSALEVIFKS